MIPKVIYKTGPFRENNLPQEIKDIFNKTIEMNPNHELIYFDDQQCEEFIIKNFNNRVLKAYKTLVPSAYKADLFRYCLLYQKGGIWSDFSQEFYLPIETFIDHENDELILVDGGFIPCAEKKGVEISFMASKPKNSIYLKAIQKVIENIESDYYGCSSFNPTGPIMFRGLVEHHNTQYKLGFEFRRFGGDNGVEDFIFYGDDKLVLKTRSSNHKKYLYYGINEKSHYSRLHEEKKIYKK